MQPQYQPQDEKYPPNQTSTSPPIVPLQGDGSEVSPEPSKQLPNQPSMSGEFADIAQRPGFYSPQENLTQSTPPFINKDLQVAATKTASDVLVAFSTDGGLPDPKIPHSNTSINQTPTQKQVSSSSIPNPHHQQHQNFISDSQHAGPRQPPEESLSAPQPSYSSREPHLTAKSDKLNSEKRNDEYPMKKRLSQSSNGTFQTAGSREQSQNEFRLQNQPLSHHSLQVGGQRSAQEDVHSGQGDFLSLPPPPPSLSRERAKTPDQPISRPFSFMEVSPDRRSQQDGEVLPRAPSMESASNHNHSNRPPSPVSPQRSMTREVSYQNSQSIPDHHDASQEYVKADEQLGIVHRPHSFSRPFRDTSLREHPAYRQEIPSKVDAEFSADRHTTQMLSGEAFLPQQYTAGYQYRGVEPATVPSADNKTISRHGSRNSTFFINYNSNARAERSQSSYGIEGYQDESHVKSSTTGEAKSKRASIFRSKNGRREDRKSVV